MKPDDERVWEESLKDKNNIDMFKVKPGGPNAKPLPKKEIFKSPKQKKLEDRMKKLEERVEYLEKELKTVKRQTAHNRRIK